MKVNIMIINFNVKTLFVDKFKNKLNLLISKIILNNLKILNLYYFTRCVKCGKNVKLIYSETSLYHNLKFLHKIFDYHNINDKLKIKLS
jgi:hypothetical protein